MKIMAVAAVSSNIHKKCPAGIKRQGFWEGMTDMKKLIRYIVILAIMLCTVSFSAWGKTMELPPNFENLVILHTNDTHGFDQRADGIQGMATVAALKKTMNHKEKKYCFWMPVMPYRIIILLILAKASQQYAL